MTSKNMHLFDEKGQDWFPIATESDIQQLISSMDNNELQLIPSEEVEIDESDIEINDEEEGEEF